MSCMQTVGDCGNLPATKAIKQFWCSNILAKLQPATTRQPVREYMFLTKPPIFCKVWVACVDGRQDMAVLHNKYLILLNKIWKISESFVDACLFCPINYFALLCQGFFSLYNQFFVLFFIWEWDDKVFFFSDFFCLPWYKQYRNKKETKRTEFS